MRDFRLTTVTFGTAPTPYLAIRTPLQLAQDKGDRFPLGANAPSRYLRSHTYVDDVLVGAGSLSWTLEMRQQIIDLLAAGGFQLNKWAGNYDDLASAGNPEDCLVLDKAAVSTLRVLWFTQADTLALCAIPTLVTCTKRMILSDVAKFFDLLGWAAPIVIVAKVYIQDLWTAGLGSATP